MGENQERSLQHRNDRFSLSVHRRNCCRGDRDERRDQVVVVMAPAPTIVDGADLRRIATEQHVNPYYLAYAFATGVGSIDEAFKRDGGNHCFTIWSSQRWSEHAVMIGGDRYMIAGEPGAFERHCDLLADYLNRNTRSVSVDKPACAELCCGTCISWKPPIEGVYGECWSMDRLDGDRSKGPAGDTAAREFCEAYMAATTQSQKGKAA
jgi:hypothetical protein